MIENPWRDLPETAPFVLPQDAPAVADHNGRVAELFQFRTGVLPEPFLGRPDGDVVFLNLNPGYTEGDEKVHADTALQEALRSMLRHERHVHPMYLLDPAFAANPGGIWWRKRLRVLADAVGGYKVLSHRVLVLEAFAYSSPRFKKPRLPLPSTAYVTNLLREAMRAERPVVVIRARRQWEALVSPTRRLPEPLPVQEPSVCVLHAEELPNGVRGHRWGPYRRLTGSGHPTATRPGGSCTWANRPSEIAYGCCDARERRGAVRCRA